jgi:hypothetical protein
MGVSSALPRRSRLWGQANDSYLAGAPVTADGAPPWRTCSWGPASLCPEGQLMGADRSTPHSGMWGLGREGGPVG